MKEALLIILGIVIGATGYHFFATAAVAELQALRVEFLLEVRKLRDEFKTKL